MKLKVNARASSLWAFTLLASLLWLPTLATAAVEADFNTSANVTGVTVTGYTGPDTALVIPGTIDGVPVTAIGAVAFLGKTGLTSVVIPEGVTSIGSDAFANCFNLASLTLPDSLTSIGEFAFQNTDLRRITIPAGITSLGNSLFQFCDRLAVVSFKGNAPTIGIDVFSGVAAGAKIYYPAGATGWGTTLGGLMANPVSTDFSYTIANNAVTITGYNGAGGAVTIPSSIEGVSVRIIGRFSFYSEKAMTSVVIPNTVTDIESSAFASSGLTAVAIPANVSSLSDDIFNQCFSLQSITVDNSNDFYAGLNGVLFDRTLTTLIAYPGGKTGPYVIPFGVQTIRPFAFSNTAVTSVEISGTVTSIGNQAFYFCAVLTEITMPSVNSVYDTVDGVLFEFNGGARILHSFPSGKAGPYTIPTSVIEIRSYAFAGSTFASIDIPAGVTSIGSNAFFFSSNLSMINFAGDPPTVGASAFRGIAGEAIISYLPEASGWGATFGDIPTAVDASDFVYAIENNEVTITGYTGSGGTLTLPSSIEGLPVTAIGPSAFYNQKTITGVVIPNTVTNIESGAFFGTRLTTVAIPASVSNIAQGAFTQCAELQAIVVDGANLVYADLDGVLFDKAVTTLITYPGGKPGPYTVPDGVQTINTSAFTDTVVTRIELPASVVSIEDRAFFRCTALTELTMPVSNGTYETEDGVLFRQNGAARILHSFPSGRTGAYTMPPDVSRIDGNAFGYCTLTSIDISASVTSIGLFAFSQSASLSTINFAGDAPVFESIIFNGIAGDATVFYQAGTTGWGATFVGIPTQLAASDFIYTIADSEVTITGYDGAGGAVTIPSSLEGFPVTTIEQFAFVNKTMLTGVVIPNSVTDIGQSAFRGTGLTTVTIPASVSSLGLTAFGSNPSLLSITVVDTNAFYADLNGVLFDKTLTTLITYPGGITGPYVIPDSVQAIDEYAFYFTQLSTLELPVSVTSIGRLAFVGQALIEVIMPASNANYDTVDGVLFEQAGDERILHTFPGAKPGPYTIPNDVTQIGESAFFGSELTSIVIPEGVTSIGPAAFRSSFKLTNVTIADTVTSIGSGAFIQCISLRSITFEGNAPTLGFSAFDFIPADAIVTYQAGTTGWGATYGDITTQVFRPTYSAWIATYPGVGTEVGYDEDPDKDGYPNGIENYLGTDPSVPSAGITFYGLLSGNIFGFIQPQSASSTLDLTFSYEWSIDLVTFYPDGASNGNRTTVTFFQYPQLPNTIVLDAEASGSVIPEQLYVRIVAHRDET